MRDWSRNNATNVSSQAIAEIKTRRERTESSRSANLNLNMDDVDI